MIPGAVGCGRRSDAKPTPNARQPSTAIPVGGAPVRTATNVSPPAGPTDARPSRSRGATRPDPSAWTERSQFSNWVAGNVWMPWGVTNPLRCRPSRATKRMDIASIAAPPVGRDSRRTSTWTANVVNRDDVVDPNPHDGGSRPNGSSTGSQRHAIREVFRTGMKGREPDRFNRAWFRPFEIRCERVGRALH